MTVILALHKVMDVPQDEFRLIIGNGPLSESFPGQYRPDEVDLLIMLGSHWYLGLPGLLVRVEDHFQCLDFHRCRERPAYCLEADAEVVADGRLRGPGELVSVVGPAEVVAYDRFDRAMHSLADGY
jgi:hypothetical protein